MLEKVKINYLLKFIFKNIQKLLKLILLIILRFLIKFTYLNLKLIKIIDFFYNS